MEEAVDPLVGVRAARVPTAEYDPDERADFNEATRRFL